MKGIKLKSDIEKRANNNINHLVKGDYKLRVVYKKSYQEKEVAKD